MKENGILTNKYVLSIYLSYLVIEIPKFMKYGLLPEVELK